MLPASSGSGGGGRCRPKTSLNEGAGDEQRDAPVGSETPLLFSKGEKGRLAPRGARAGGHLVEWLLLLRMFPRTHAQGW